MLNIHRWCTTSIDDYITLPCCLTLSLCSPNGVGPGGTQALLVNMRCYTSEMRMIMIRNLCICYAGRSRLNYLHGHNNNIGMAIDHLYWIVHQIGVDVDVNGDGGVDVVGRW